MRLPSNASSRNVEIRRFASLETYDPIDDVSSPQWRGVPVIKYMVLAGVTGTALTLLTASVLERVLVGGMDVHRDFSRVHSADVIDLNSLPPMRPYRQDANCKPDGSICICSGGFATSGNDVHGYNTFSKEPMGTACQQWHFRVGDVILVEKPAELKKAYVPAYVVAAVSDSPVVHVAIVTKVPPPGVNQTADNVIVTEALKGAWKRVLQNTFREIVERFPFGGISIRRIDEKRFPLFFSSGKQAAITKWADARVGDGFDHDMLIPIKRRFAAGKRYIAINPSCAERQRAMAMYRKGGPGRWICSEFVGWTLAFAGGINTDYGLLSSNCDVPSWTIQNIQPLPGELTDMSFFDQDKPWHMPCEAVGCFVGVPAVPEWSGGTTTVMMSTATSSAEVASTTTPTTSTVAKKLAPNRMSKEKEDGKEGKAIQEEDKHQDRHHLRKQAAPKRDS